MNHKVDETVLMAYLYGELNKEEKQEVETYLKEHPESARTLEEFNKVRDLMGMLEDQDPPTTVVLNTETGGTRWRKLVPWLSIAAAISLILITGFLTKASISWQDKQLSIRFGTPEMVQEDRDMTREELSGLIQSALAQQQEVYSGQLNLVKTELEQRLDSQTPQYLVRTPVASGITEQELQVYLAQYQEQQIGEIASLLQDNVETQREELQTFLAEYHQFLEQRRLQDLQLIEAGFQAMQDNVDQQKTATEEILANIITTVNNTNH